MSRLYQRSLRFALLAVIAVCSDASLSNLILAQSGIFVLDDCDAKFKGKQSYEDRLTMIDSAGTRMFRISGFNNCQTIGSSHMIAADVKRHCVWVVENVAHRLRRFDLTGKVTLEIPNVKSSAIAVDVETGNICVLENDGGIAKGKTTIYDERGQQVVQSDVSGWDVAYDRASKSFWIAEKQLTKISATDGRVAFAADITTWCASSVDVESNGKTAWVAVRQHENVAGSANQLLKFAADGKKLAVVELREKMPFRVSIDPADGSVWVAQLRKSVERYSPDGVLMSQHPVHALAVQVDPAGDGVWIVSTDDVYKMTRTGDIIERVKHADQTWIAWIAPFK